MGRKFKKSSNVEDLRKHIFRKISGKSYSSGRFEARVIRLDNIVKIMSKVNITHLKVHERAIEHWNAFLSVSNRLEGRTLKVFVDVTFHNKDSDDPIADDDSYDSWSSESPPPPNDGMLANIRSPLKNEIGDIFAINLMAIQAVMQLPEVVKQDAEVLQNVNPLDGRFDWFTLRKADLGEDLVFRI